MKLFLDFEFTGLHQNTTPISLGIVSENETTFYAEFGDYDHNQVDWWITENILSQLVFHNPGYGYNTGKGWCNYSTIEGATEVYGNREFVKLALENWLNQSFNDEEYCIWSDCYAYDWVLFNELFGHAFSIPTSVYYIPFDLATMLKVKGYDPDVNREQFAQLESGSEQKHNSLWDAKVIKKCYERLQGE